MFCNTSTCFLTLLLIFPLFPPDFLPSLTAHYSFFPTCFVLSLLPSISPGSLFLFRAQRATQRRCMSWHAGEEQTHDVSKLWCNSGFGLVWQFDSKYVYFSRVSSMTVWMTMSVSLSVHHCHPDWNILTTIGWIAIKFCQIINPVNFGDHLTFLLASHICSFEWNVWTVIRRIAMKFSSDIHVPVRMNCSWFLL